MQGYAPDALAQGVDRRDRRTVDVGARETHASQCERAALVVVAIRGEICGKCGHLRFAFQHFARALQPVLRLGETTAQALAQFLCGGDGERRDEDALDAEPAFEQQAQVEHADAPGLAGAGARLDQRATVERHRTPVEGFEAPGRSHQPFPPRLRGANSTHRSGSSTAAIASIVETNSRCAGAASSRMSRSRVSRFA